MTKTTTSPVLNMIRRMVEVRGVRELPDRDLLRMFVDRQDQSAFEALLRRHGPMVLSVCRGVLGTDASAEDAFQATFIVLVRKASSIRTRASLASWLHGVAYRTALKARAQTATRQKYEAQRPQKQPSVEDSLTWREVQQVLQHELNKLPAHYREPLVLFHLEGLTQQAAASQLGVAKSTLRERLDRGRMLLRKRLISRGMGSSIILAVTVWPSATASASVPDMLMRSTAEAARAITMGGAMSSIVSDRVAALARGVGNAMIITKGKLIAAAALLILVSFGATVKLAQGPDAEPRAIRHLSQQAAPKPQSDNVPKAWAIGSVLQGHQGQVRKVAFSPDGKWLVSASRDNSAIVWDVAKQAVHQTLNCPDEVLAVAFAPDGKTVATSSGMDNDSHLITLWQPETGKEVGVLKDNTNPVWNLVFSEDSNRLISISCPIDFTKDRAANDRGALSLWDVGAKQKLASLESEQVSGAVFSHDGKKMVTSGSSNDGAIKLWDLHDNLVATVEKVLVEHQVCCLAVAPDGKSFVTAPVSGWSSVATIWDFDTGKDLGSFEHKTASIRCLAFSPDGKTLVTGGWTTTNKEAPKKKGEAEPEADLAGELKFWDVATGEEKQTLTQKSPVTSVAFSPDGKTLAVGQLHDDKLRIKAAGGFEPPPAKQKGVVNLLTRGKS